PDEFGIATLAAMMMDEGTENYSAEAFEIELQKLGSSISVGAGTEATTINVQTLVSNLDATLALLEERLFRSTFTQEDLDRLRQQLVESIQADQEQPAGIANTVWQKLLYGQGHAFSVSTSGTIPTLETMTLEQVTAFASNNLVSQNLKIAVVGDVP